MNFRYAASAKLNAFVVDPDEVNTIRPRHTQCTETTRAAYHSRCLRWRFVEYSWGGSSGWVCTFRIHWTRTTVDRRDCTR